MPFTTRAYAASAPGGILQPWSVERRNLLDSDVHLDILYCGICHSDVSQVNQEWGPVNYPIVPGHEIVGRVLRVGPGVTKFKPGDIAAVGCLVDSCGACSACKKGVECYCAKRTPTYNGKVTTGEQYTKGGYSHDIVVKESFVCRVPDALHDKLQGVGPLLCAGITTYSPMMRHSMNRKGARIGIIGLGGLGHMAAQFGRAFGNEVTIISSNPSKKDEAERLLGISNFICSKDPEAMGRAARTLDYIVDTVSAPKTMAMYMELLDVGGVLVTVGLPPHGTEIKIPPSALIFQQRSIAGSLIGGLQETQEMLNFCGEKGITSIVEVVKMQEINQAYDRMSRSDVKYRFVIDMKASGTF